MSHEFGQKPVNVETLANHLARFVGGSNNAKKLIGRLLDDEPGLSSSDIFQRLSFKTNNTTHVSGKQEGKKKKGYSKRGR